MLNEIPFDKGQRGYNFEFHIFVNVWLYMILKSEELTVEIDRNGNQTRNVVFW